MERVACACELLAFPPLEGPVGSQLYWALWGHEEKEMHLLSRRGEKRKDGICIEGQQEGWGASVTEGWREVRGPFESGIVGASRRGSAL